MVAIICMSVVLPAPFGPSNPSTPEEIVKERSLTPYTPDLYFLDTFSIRIIGIPHNFRNRARARAHNRARALEFNHDSQEYTEGKVFRFCRGSAFASCANA